MQIGDIELEASRPPQPGVLQFEEEAEEEVPPGPAEEGEASSTESSALRGAGIQDDEAKGATSSSVLPELNLLGLGLPSTVAPSQQALASREAAVERPRTRSQGTDAPVLQSKEAAAPRRPPVKKLAGRRRRSDT